MSLKFLAKVLASIILISIVLVIVVISFMDFSQYKQDIQSLVKKSTGRDLSIEGDLKLSVFPSIAITMNNISLSNPKGFDGNFFKGEKISVNLNLIPLIMKEIDIKGVELIGLEFNLEKNAKGITNFDDLLNINTAKETNNQQEVSNINNIEGTKTTKANLTTNPNNETKKASKTSLPDLAIANLIIDKSKITWHDKESKKKLVLQDFYLSSKNLDLQSNKDLPPIKSSGKLIVDNQNQPINFNLKTILNFGKQNANLESLEVKYSNVTAKLNIQAQQILDNLQFNGKIDVPKFNLQKLMQQKEPGVINNANLVADISFDNNILKLSPFTIETDKAKITGDSIFNVKTGVLTASPVALDIASHTHNLAFSAKTFATQPSYKITAESQDFEIAELLEKFGKKAMKGKSSYNISLRCNGKTTDKMKQTLNGTIKINANNGEIYGVDIKKSIELAHAAIAEVYSSIQGDFNLKELLESTAKSKDSIPSSSDISPFNKLEATTIIENGIAKNDDFALSHNDYLVTGRGEANLASDTINYVARARLKSLAESKDENIKRVNKFLFENPIEIKITGKASDPTIRPDIRSLVSLAVKSSKKSFLKKVTTKAIKKATGLDFLPSGDVKSDAKSGAINKIIDVLR